jgi:hypothetical protein
MKSARPFTLPRRAALAAGMTGLVLPLLESLPPRLAHAQAGSAHPRRFVVFFSPNGTIAPNWEPAGTATSFQLSPILAPLAPHQGDIVIVQGVDQQGGGGDGHQNGIGGMLTGTMLNPGPFTGGDGSSSGWAGGISVDQRIAEAIGGDTRFKSIELGVQVGSADNWGRMCYAGSDQPLPPEDDPNRAFARIFGDLTRDPAELARLRAHRHSVLDRVAARYARLSARASASDQRKIEAHLTGIRDIESRLDKDPAQNSSCHAPPLDPGLAVQTNDAFPAVGRLQMDLLVMALACDLTRVASLQWSRSVSQVRFSWLGITDAHHDLSHLGDDDAASQDKLTRINRWYAEQLSYLIASMKAVPEGSGSLLDNTVILWCNELGKGNIHSRENAPYVLAGRAGGALKTGRYLRYDGMVPHNNLLVSILNVMGVSATTFGKPEWCTGPLPNLA